MLWLCFYQGHSGCTEGRGRRAKVGARNQFGGHHDDQSKDDDGLGEGSSSGGNEK